jgi:hypothetical protein
VTFSDFLDDPVYGSTAVDFQARWLAGRSERDLRGPELPGLALAEPFGPQDPPLDEATLHHRAWATLEECELVGTTERLPEFVDALGRLLGRWLPPPPVLNVSPETEAVSAVGAARVRALSPVDVDVHQAANVRLDRSLATLPPIPSITECPITDLPYEQTMADALSGTGWHERLHTEAAGWHRWSGPSTRSTIRLPVRLAGPACLRIRVVASCARAVLDGMRVTVDDRAVEVSRVDHRHGVDVVGDVELDAARPVLLELEIAHTMALAGATSSDEPAGIAVAAVRFEPTRS